VRELCSEHEVVFILDEIITGFRVGLGGAQAYLGVTPDLATFGKAMAGGFPASCLAGKRELMGLIASGQVTHSGTFNSNVPAMAAALATIGELEKDQGQVYQRLHQLGRRLSAGLKDLTEQYGIAAQVQGPGPMFHFAFAEGPLVTDYRSFAGQCDTGLYHRFARLMLEGGVRVTPRGLWYISAAHTGDDIDFALQAAESALERL
jgi:glutamate-1-semialdehyde 2,1-aminomutase